MTEITPRYYRVRDVATILSIGESEVRRLVDKGVLHRRYIGDSGWFYRITAASVEAYEASLSSERP